jgi:hypothetical protein
VQESAGDNRHIELADTLTQPTAELSPAANDSPRVVGTDKQTRPSPSQSDAIEPRLQLVPTNDTSLTPLTKAQDKATETSSLDREQLALLRQIVEQLYWLMGDHSCDAPPTQPQAPLLVATMRQPDFESVLRRLRDIRAEDAWPDRRWVLDLDEAREKAKEAFAAFVEPRQALPEGIERRDLLEATESTAIEALNSAFMAIVQHIVSKYPETRTLQ